jgi:hypothetical protein
VIAFSFACVTENAAFSQSTEHAKALETEVANAKLHPAVLEYNSQLDKLVSEPPTNHSFSSGGWKSHEKNRLRMVTDLVWSKPLIGMNREALYTLLGLSEYHAGSNKETYTLYQGPCGNNPTGTYLDVHYKNDLVEGLQITDDIDGVSHVSHLFTMNPGEKTQ